MRRRKGFLLWLRLTAVLLGLSITVAAVTYAVLQSSPVTLASNQITTSAGLAISLDGQAFPQTVTGFSFSGGSPGGPAFPTNGNTFYIRNTGSANLAIKALITTTPTVTTTNPNGAAVDLSKVFFEITRVDNNNTYTVSVKSLIDSGTSGYALNDMIAAGATVQYSLRVSIASDAFTAQSLSITGINLAFSGIGT